MLGHDALEKLQFSFELAAFIVCLLLVIIQQCFLNYYFIHFTEEKQWFWWVAIDAIVVVVMIWLIIFAIKYNRQHKKQFTSADADVPYAFAAWAIYAIVLSIKMALIFRLIVNKMDKNDSFGFRTLQIILGLSAIIFLFLVWSHHYTTHNSPRQIYLNYLSSSVTLDIIDSISFLQLLNDNAIGASANDNQFLQCTILFFACLNFILPTFALLKLRDGKKLLLRWVPLPYDKFYTLLYFLTVNVPYFVIRLYFWAKTNNDVSIFVIKNVVMVLLAIREVWLAFLHWKQNKVGFCENMDKNDNISTLSIMTRYSSAANSKITPQAW